MLKIDTFTTGRETRFSSFPPLINFRAMKYDVFKELYLGMQKYIIVSCIVGILPLFAQACQSTKNMTLNSAFTTPAQPPISPGANQTLEYLPQLRGKRVALVGNQTSIIFQDFAQNKFIHLVDSLLSLKVNLVKVFSPEHGFRGNADAGELVSNGKDLKTGLPIVSLYGNNKKPKAEQLADVDIVLFDLQDVGVRFYTYISTLHYVMEACAESKIPIIVLDRPNPNIDIIDGPVLEMEHKSFIGMHPVPVLYGLTIGEYAQMINGEKWITTATQLTVIPIINYSRTSRYSLPVPPSPNLRTDNAIAWYASLCFFEGTVISVGRGTDKPFEQIGHPDYPNKNYSFTPKPSLGSKDPLHNGELCFGINYADSIAPRKLSLEPILRFYQVISSKQGFFLKNNFIYLLAGNSLLKSQIISGKTEYEIRETWQKKIDIFKSTRALYMLY